MEDYDVQNGAFQAPYRIILTGSGLGGFEAGSCDQRRALSCERTVLWRFRVY